MRIINNNHDDAFPSTQFTMLIMLLTKNTINNRNKDYCLVAQCNLIYYICNYFNDGTLHVNRSMGGNCILTGGNIC